MEEDVRRGGAGGWPGGRVEVLTELARTYPRAPAASSASAAPCLPGRFLERRQRVQNHLAEPFEGIHVVVWEPHFDGGPHERVPVVPVVDRGVIERLERRHHLSDVSPVTPLHLVVTNVGRLDEGMRFVEM